MFCSCEKNWFYTRLKSYLSTKLTFIIALQWYHRREWFASQNHRARSAIYSCRFSNESIKNEIFIEFYCKIPQKRVWLFLLSRLVSGPRREGRSEAPGGDIKLIGAESERRRSRWHWPDTSQTSTEGTPASRNVILHFLHSIVCGWGRGLLFVLFSMSGHQSWYWTLEGVTSLNVDTKLRLCFSIGTLQAISQWFIAIT